LSEFINDNFPEIKTGFVDVEALPELAAQNNIFSVPTITVLFDNKEFLRKSRNINLTELHAEIQRPYSLYF
jgi:thioredoxin 1